MLYVMLVGAYPFERPEDKHDNKKLQKMIQVSYTVAYTSFTHLLSMPRSMHWQMGVSPIPNGCMRETAVVSWAVNTMHKLNLHQGRLDACQS